MMKRQEIEGVKAQLCDMWKQITLLKRENIDLMMKLEVGE